MKNNYGVWDLEHFKVTEPNKYDNIIDELKKHYMKVIASQINIKEE